jgi:hypothetical protein
LRGVFAKNNEITENAQWRRSGPANSTPEVDDRREFATWLDWLVGRMIAHLVAPYVAQDSAGSVAG